MEIQRIKLMDRDGVTAETIANLTQYPPDDWGAKLPIHVRGALKAPIMLRRVPIREQYSTYAKDNVYDLIIRRDVYPSIDTTLGLWSYDDWEWFDFFTIEGCRFRVPRHRIECHEVNNFKGWSFFIAHCLYRVIRGNCRYPLYRLAEYSEAAEFYTEVNLVLECGNVDVLLTDGGVLYVFDKKANPLGCFNISQAAIGHMRLKVDEQLNVKFDKDFVRRAVE